LHWHDRIAQKMKLIRSYITRLRLTTRNLCWRQP
jgi:hypothetical protein